MSGVLGLTSVEILDDLQMNFDVHPKRQNIFIQLQSNENSVLRGRYRRIWGKCKIQRHKQRTICSRK